MGRYTRLEFALASTLLVAFNAGCGGAPQSGETRIRQARQSETTATPLWTVTYDAQPLAYHASAVDDDDNTYIAAFTPQGGDVSLLHKFDPNGSFLFKKFIGSGQFDVAAVRGNKTGAVTAATSYNNSVPQLDIRRFDPSGGTLFEYKGASSGSYTAGAHSVDICSDGTTVFLEQDKDSPSPLLVMVDTTGAVSWTSTLDGMTPGKVRCYGNGQIVVGGTIGGSPALAFFESDGTVDPAWTSCDTGASGVLFDRNNDVIYLGATLVGSYAVYAVDSSANFQWSWTSAGPNDSLSGIAASAAITVVGTRNVGGALSDYIAQLDTTGTLLWDGAVPLTAPPVGSAYVAGVSVDAAERAFVCDSSGDGTSATLYDTDGSTVWSASSAPVMAGFADVSDSVARCIGGTSSGGIGIVAFQVQ